MRKILSIICVLALIMVIVSACGGKEANKTTNQETSQNKSQSSPSASKDAGKQEKVAISYLTWRTGDNITNGLKPAFEAENPNITLNIQSIDGVDKYLQAQKVRMLSGDVDVTSIRSETFTDYVKNGKLMDITGQALLDKVTPSSLKTTTVDGKVYAMPTSIDLIGIWYNKDLFKKYNLVVPKTWDEFLHVCDVFKANNVVPMTNGGKDTWPMEFDIYPFVQQVLVEHPDIFQQLDAGKAKYTDKAFVDMFKNIQNFYKLGYIDKNEVGLTYTQAVDLFSQQKTGMLIQGEWAGKNIQDAKAQFDVGVFPMPIPGQGDKITVPVSVGIYDAVVSSTKHKDAALKLLEFFATPKGMNFIQPEKMYPLKDMQLDPNGLINKWIPLTKFDATDFFYSLQYPGANTEMNKGFQSLSINQISLEQLAKNVQAAQDKKGN